MNIKSISSLIGNTPLVSLQRLNKTKNQLFVYAIMLVPLPLYLYSKVFLHANALGGKGALRQ